MLLLSTTRLVQKMLHMAFLSKVFQSKDLPAGTPNGHHGGLLEGQTELETSNKSMSDAVVVDMSAVMNNVNLKQDHSNRRV